MCTSMPRNVTTGTNCSIYPIDGSIPLLEYKHHTMKSTLNGAIQEIVLIESNEGTAFEIKLDIQPTAYAALHALTEPPNHSNRRDQPRYAPALKEDDYLIFVILDGINAQRSKRFRGQRTSTRISGVYARDGSSSRYFQFSALQLVDPDDHQPSASQDPNDQMCDDEKIIQALGTIQVNVVRCKLGPPQPVPNRNKNQKGNQSNRSGGKPARGQSAGAGPGGCAESLQTTNQMKFSERSKKASKLNNTAGLSQPVPIPSNGRGRGGGGGGGGGGGSSGPPGAKKNSRPVLSQDPHPFLQFIFNYKPRAILEAEGIIAPPPPPPPSPPLAGKPSKDSMRRSTSKRSSSPRKPPTGLAGQHDYQSNSELHSSSLRINRTAGINEPDEKAFNQLREHKPKMKPTEPVCIAIQSDSESDAGAKELLTSAVRGVGASRTEDREKRQLQRTSSKGKTNGTTNGTNGIVPKPEPKTEPRDNDNHPTHQNGDDHNANRGRQNLHASPDSKKRARSITADLKPNNKRTSLGGHNPSASSSTTTNHNNNVASKEDTSDNRGGFTQVPKAELKENINSHHLPPPPPPPLNTNTNSTTASNGGYRQHATVDHDESSDDDDKFKDKIIGSVSTTARPTTNTRPGPSPSTTVQSTNRIQNAEEIKKPSPQSLNHLNNRINHQNQTHSNHNYRQPQNASLNGSVTNHHLPPQNGSGSNFFDLTGIDDDSD
ncbi:hypothetical protein PSTT_00905 [Puccinia striiformis]|uniref:Uncharacterized protein n=1 Tax=Puccinia striiformis TaxID=27350 RepID=A0A2S4W5M3_9BASI|nr:hypothetical protein PSTT_00905 [Puccinia striiformis]